MNPNKCCRVFSTYDSLMRHIKRTHSVQHDFSQNYVLDNDDSNESIQIKKSDNTDYDTVELQFICV